MASTGLNIRGRNSRENVANEEERRQPHAMVKEKGRKLRRSLSSGLSGLLVK